MKRIQVEDEPGSTTDDEIIGLVLRGRVDDFEILLNRYRGYVFKIVSGLLPPEAVADHSHDIFIKVYRSLPKYQNGTIFKKWLAGIAIHSCYDYWRKYYRNLEIPLSSLTEDHQKWIDDVVASQAGDAFSVNERQKEAREILQQAMAGLSAKDRVLLTLVHLEGFSVRETAEMLGWSLINVKVRAHRTREKLRRRITAMLAGGI